jgi:chitinase
MPIACRVLRPVAATLALLACSRGAPAPADGNGGGGGGGGGGKWVTAYYAAWYRDMYPPSKVDFSALTHLVVGRAAPGNGTAAPYGTVALALGPPGPGDVSTLVARAHEARRKALLMLGGAGDGAAFLGSTADGVRATFVTNLLALLDQYGFDGVDVDWEEGLAEPETQRRLLALLDDLRARRPGLLLTFPAPWQNANESGAPPFFAKVAERVDQLNFMSYAMAGPWGGWVTWHFAALDGAAPSRPTSIAYTAQAYAALGIPKAKIGIGIGFYGMNYGPPNTGPLQAPAGAFQNDDNEWRYNRLVEKGYLARGTPGWDDGAKMGWRTYEGGFTPAGASTAGFLSYEDERSIAAKGAWVREQGYGGTIVWTLNYGCTDPGTGANPLLDAVKKAFLP